MKAQWSKCVCVRFLPLFHFSYCDTESTEISLTFLTPFFFGCVDGGKSSIWLRKNNIDDIYN
jgi:hypothetical protein